MNPLFRTAVDSFVRPTAFAFRTQTVDEMSEIVSRPPALKTGGQSLLPEGSTILNWGDLRGTGAVATGDETPSANKPASASV